MGRVGYKCIVRTCNNMSSITNTNIKFHSIPKDKKICLIWLENCDRMDLCQKSSISLNKSYRVCGSHFEKKMYFTDRLLLHRAVPTIFTESTSSTSPIVTTSNILCSPPIIPRQLDYPVSSLTSIMLPEYTNSVSDSIDSEFDLICNDVSSNSSSVGTEVVSEVQTKTSHIPHKTLRSQLRAKTQECIEYKKALESFNSTEHFIKQCDIFLAPKLSKIVKTYINNSARTPREINTQS